MIAPPRGLSQLSTSFVDFLCQGIRRAPLVSYLLTRVYEEMISSWYYLIQTYVCDRIVHVREPPSFCDFALVMIQDHVDVSRHQFRTDAARYADVKVPGAGALGTGCWRSWPDRTRPPIWFCLEVSQGGELSSTLSDTLIVSP